MIEELAGFPEGTLGFKISGHVTGDDYDSVLTPAIDKAIEEHDRVKLLIQFGPEFEGYRLAAMWDDTKLGLRHWSGFGRMAILADSNWIRSGVRALGFMMPCPVRLFDVGELDNAKRWLSESLGAIHLDQEGDLVFARLLGKLEPSAYDGVNEDIDGMMSRSAHVRLAVDLREFDGWSGIDALGNHLSLVREHRRIPERVVVVGDKAWQRLAEKVMSRFINAETRYFNSDQYDAAITWVSS